MGYYFDLYIFFQNTVTFTVAVALKRSPKEGFNFLKKNNCAQ